MLILCFLSQVVLEVNSEFIVEVMYNYYNYFLNLKLKEKLHFVMHYIS